MCILGVSSTCLPLETAESGFYILLLTCNPHRINIYLALLLNKYRTGIEWRPVILRKIKDARIQPVADLIEAVAAVMLNCL